MSGGGQGSAGGPGDGNGAAVAPAAQSHRDLAPELGLPPWVRVQVVDGAGELAVAAGLWTTGVLADAQQERGTASLALAGGSTPRGLYRVLAGPFRWRADWERVEVFQGDERAVPPDHDASNFRIAHEELLSRLPVEEGRIHRMEGEAGGEEAARRYEAELLEALGEPPRLDLVLLGLGDDGHTASLFPAAFAGHGEDPGHDPHPGRWVAATEAPSEPRQRVSLTLSTLAQARQVLFLVQGSGKAAAVARVFQALRSGGAAAGEATEAGAGRPQESLPPAGSDPQPGDGAIPPAARVRPDDGAALWLLDREAISLAAFAFDGEAGGDGAEGDDDEGAREVPDDDGEGGTA